MERTSGVSTVVVDPSCPVSLTSESSSVVGRGGKDGQGKARLRKAQLSHGSAASHDSGFGQVEVGRQHSESPTLPPRRRYHQHYHRQHGKTTSTLTAPTPHPHH